MVSIKEKIVNSADHWVDKYSDFLFRFASLRVNDTKKVEDLVQETFLSALKSYKSFNQKSSEQTWLTSILKHKIIDHYRKQQSAFSAENIESEYEASENDKNGTAKYI